MNENEKKPLTVDDISPIIPSEKGEVSPKIINALQCALDSIQRHILGVAKIMTDSGKNPVEQIGNNPTLLVKGFESRFAYKMIATYPALLLKQIIPEDTNKYATSAITTFAETSIGAPLEVSGAKNSLKAIGKNIDSFRSFANTSKAAFTPFLCRNYIGWMVLNNPEEDLTKRFVLGACAGILSSPLDSLGNYAMAISSESKSLAETYLEAAKNIKFQNMVKAAPIRAVAAGGSAVILSKQMQEIISDVINPLYQEAQNLNNKNSQNTAKANPIVKTRDEKPQNLAEEAAKVKEGDSKGINKR